MDEMQQKIVQLVLAAMLGDQQATQYILQIMQAALQGDQQAVLLAQMIQAVSEQMQLQQALMAKFGAKLNYIKSLRGQCPDGYEMQFYKQGGQVCKRCMKKALKALEGTDLEKPSNLVDAFKCGRKMKKKENGGSVEMDKCGGKTKKKACGGAVKKDLKGDKMFGPAAIPNSEFKYKEFAADQYGPRMRIGTVGGGIGKPGYEIQAEDLETRNRFTGQNDWEYTETGSGRTPSGGWSNNLYNKFSDSDENPNAGVALNYIQRRAALSRAKQGPFTK